MFEPRTDLLPSACSFGQQNHPRVKQNCCCPRNPVNNCILLALSSTYPSKSFTVLHANEFYICSQNQFKRQNIQWLIKVQIVNPRTGYLTYWTVKPHFYHNSLIKKSVHFQLINKVFDWYIILFLRKIKFTTIWNRHSYHISIYMNNLDISPWQRSIWGTGNNSIEKILPQNLSPLGRADQ